MAKSGPGQSHHLKMLSTSPRWVEVAQVVEPFSTSFLSTLTGNWMAHLEEETQSITLINNAGILNSNLKDCKEAGLWMQAC